jgi:predicted ATPase
MKQPDIHLHPRVQAELADVFIAAVQAKEDRSPRAIQLIVESHSEHFLNRLQRRIAEASVDPAKIAIYFATTVAGTSRIEELRLDRFGEIENWPDDFFGDEMGEISARSKAALQRKIREREAS